MGSEFVFTCQQDFEQICVNEMIRINKDVKFIKWLDGGVGIAGYTDTFTFSEISKIFREEKPVFLRHIFPVDLTFDYDKFSPSGFDLITDTYNKYIEKNGKSLTVPVSVQIRNKAGTGNLTEIKSYIIKRLEESGCEYNKSDPQVIISIFISDSKVYAGISTGEENLSIWSGGMRHYAFNEHVISRAEFKLLELFEYFPELAKLNERSSFIKPLALDLGASPGGWTKILIEKGYKVTAVDPNKLSDALSGCPDVIYHKGLIEDFIAKNKKQKRGSADLFDLIVNDMRMHAVQSAKIMNAACGYLKDGGYSVMTIKLNKNNKTAMIKDALNILKEKYDVLFLKHLFHNRLEITAVLRKKL